MILTIFGYPKTGKTLLFNLLTDKDEEVSKFSTSTDEYHKAVVDVPDERLKLLSEHFNLPPVYARIEYLDAGAISFGEVKSATFIDLLRRADGLIHIVRGFEDVEIIHPKETINPARDIRTMDDELITTDFLSAEKRLEKLESDIKKMKSEELIKEHELLKKIKGFLEDGKPLREIELKPNEEVMIKGFKFLSIKPLINIINADENSYTKYTEFKKEPEKNTSTIIFSGKIEHELLELEEEDRKLFQEEYGMKDYQYIKEYLIRSSYKLMDLISFFTVGKEEVKAWTVKNNDNAYTAAGKIHTDIQQGFIKGEVINWKDFLDSGGFPQAKEKGLLRLEGKDYLIRDGDMVQFRFSK